jgi:hypothetical protein
VSAVDKAAYLRLRGEDYRPGDARDMARGRHGRPSWSYDETDESIRIEQDGWLVIIDVEHDEADPELGVFTNVWSGDALDLGKELAPLGYRYFLPHTSWRDHYASLHDLGMSRHEADCTARRYVNEDLLMQLGVDFPAWIVSVRVLRNGVQLGLDAIGGVRFEKDGIREQQDVVDYAHDSGLIDEALEEAQAKLKELIGG